MTPRICPACRLPKPPDQVHVGEDAGAYFVFAICRHCAQRYTKLPTGTRHKLLNAALARSAAAPDRYWSTQFADKGAMFLAAGMLAHPACAKEVLQAVNWCPSVEGMN